MNNRMPKTPWAWVPSLYFAEGLPYVAVMAITIILYKQLGLSNGEITFYTSWLYLPWVIKPLWSPFIGLFRTRRWWIAAMELLIGAAFGGVAFTIPTAFWLQGSLFFFWVMAFSCATHDVAADRFYLLESNQHHTRLFGIRTAFYRLATIFGQGLLVMIAGNLQVIYRNSISFSWSVLFYGVTGLFIVLWLWHSYVLPRPEQDVPRTGAGVRTLWGELTENITSFFRQPQAASGIMFMLLFCLPLALLSKVAPLFLIDAAHAGGLGLSPQEFGLVQGTVGVVGLTVGSIVGSVSVGRDGLKRWLWPMVGAVCLPALVYVALSYALPGNFLLVNLCVFCEQFGCGFGLTAYTFYLLYYSRGNFRQGHYGLCTAFMSLSMMLPGLMAGWLQEAVGYRMFFIIAAVCCIFTFGVAALVRVDADFGVKTDDEETEEEGL